MKRWGIPVEVLGSATADADTLPSPSLAGWRGWVVVRAGWGWGPRPDDVQPPPARTKYIAPLKMHGEKKRAGLW